MARFNSKSVKRKPDSVNKMGERAFKLSPEEELVSTVLTTTLSRSYYESESSIINRIKKAAEKCDPYFLAQLAIYTRREANMRSSSHLLAGLVAPLASGTEWGSNFYKKIVVRPDDISEIISYYLAKLARKKTATGRRGSKWENKSITNAMRKGFRSAMEEFDAYQLDKYKMNSRNITLIDMVNMLRPKPTRRNAEAYRRLMVGESLSDLYGSEITEKSVSAAGPSKTAKAKAYSKVINSKEGIPLMNAVKNLRNIINDAPEQVNEVCRQLTNKEKIVNSRMLPFRFATAYTMVEAMKSKSGSRATVVFEKDRKTSKTALINKVLTALDTAIELSCHNIPKLAGSTCILIDHSGSMRGDYSGNSLVSAMSTTNSSNIATLFGCMMAYAQDNVYIGLFGNKLLEYKYNREKGLLWNYREAMKLGSNCGGHTEAGIYQFMKACVNEEIRVDNFITFSDMVIGAGCSWYGLTHAETSGNFLTLFKKFRKVQPWCNTIAVSLRQTDGYSVFDKSLGVTQVAGWSERIFDVIDKATAGYKEIIKNIKSIEI